jgi:hypothetical protein
MAILKISISLVYEYKYRGMPEKTLEARRNTKRYQRQNRYIEVIMVRYNNRNMKKKKEKAKKKEKRKQRTKIYR